ncbi:MAG: helix-turn-helix domain-containing protein [Hyphomicrobium sp.]|uniref:helix-turn-helix domain-containing protein n=1 Tax=Hyphomicrobium sp. TaxID=82 RepID=UPI003D111CA1
MVTYRRPEPVPNDIQIDPMQVGIEIRDLRKAKRMTIKELSLATGLSVGHLSEIERGLASPSVKALRDVAEALGATIGWFMHAIDGGDARERDYVVRAANRRTLGLVSEITDELLSPNLRGHLEVLLSRFPPQAADAEVAYSHACEEAGVVLSGALDLWIGEQCFNLHEGDSFSLPSTTPHRYRNPGQAEALVIRVITPPTL